MLIVFKKGLFVVSLYYCWIHGLARRLLAIILFSGTSFCVCLLFPHCD